MAITGKRIAARFVDALLMSDNFKKPEPVKKAIISLLLLVITLSAAAQGKRHFDPAKFKAEMEQYITVKACLTPSEAAALFPLYDEMKKEMRGLYNKLRKLKQIKPCDEQGCKEAVGEMDRIELEMKQVQMNYHARFLSVISASKPFDVIKAEERFHKDAVRRATRDKK